MRPSPPRTSTTRTILLVTTVVVLTLYIVILSFQQSFDKESSSSRVARSRRAKSDEEVIEKHMVKLDEHIPQHQLVHADHHEPHHQDDGHNNNHHHQHENSEHHQSNHDQQHHLRETDVAHRLRQEHEEADHQQQGKKTSQHHEDEEVKKINNQFHHIDGDTTTSAKTPEISSTSTGTTTLPPLQTTTATKVIMMPTITSFDGGTTDAAKKKQDEELEKKMMIAELQHGGGNISSKNRKANNRSDDALAALHKIRAIGEHLQHVEGARVTRYHPPKKPEEEIVSGAAARNWLKQIETGEETMDPMDDAALAKKFHDIDIVYTWVNGSEMMHRWKKSQVTGRMVLDANSRDRDSDELRHSMRSIDEHVRWHTGRITIVSPGHVPHWLDLTNPRVRVVHQDAIILDEQERFTFNTNSIEQHIWRLPALSDRFIQFNDDYFVMRDAPPSTFFNEHGGPVLLYENGVVQGNMYQVKKWLRDGGKVWIAGVFHTNAIMQSLIPREKRSFMKYIKHAPFTLCRNYLKALQTRMFPGAYQKGARFNRFRAHLDVLTPFIHNGFAFAIPDVMVNNKSLARAKQHAMERSHSEEERKWLSAWFSSDHRYDFREDLEGELKACPPVTWKTGHAADSRLVVLKDDVKYNEKVVNDTVQGKYQFIALNDGFGNAQLIAPQLFRLVEKWFPKPSEFERPSSSSFSSHHTGGSVVDHTFKHRHEQQQDQQQENEDAKQQQERNNEEEKGELPEVTRNRKQLRRLVEGLDTGRMGIILFASHCDGLCGSVRSSMLGFSRLRQRTAPYNATRNAEYRHFEHDAAVVWEPPPTTATTSTTTKKASSSSGSASGSASSSAQQQHHQDQVSSQSTTTADPLHQTYATGGKARRKTRPNGGGRRQQNVTLVDDHNNSNVTGLSNNNNGNNHTDNSTSHDHRKQHPHPKKGLQQQQQQRDPLADFKLVDEPGLPTFVIVSVFPEGTSMEDRAERMARLRRCRCPIGSFNHLDTEEVDTIPRLFRFRKDTVVLDGQDVLAETTRFATARHADQVEDHRLIVTSEATLARVVQAARRHISDTTIPLMVVTTADAVFGEAVTAAHVTAGFGAPLNAGIVHCAPLPSSVHPKLRQTPERKSDVLLMPLHAHLSYLRTYPIPAFGRSYEVPLPQFLRFFLLSYKTGTLGFNPNFVRNAPPRATNTAAAAATTQEQPSPTAGVTTTHKLETEAPQHHESNTTTAQAQHQHHEEHHEGDA